MNSASVRRRRSRWISVAALLSPIGFSVLVATVAAEEPQVLTADMNRREREWRQFEKYSWIQVHQENVRALEEIGYRVIYERAEDAPAREQALVIRDTTAYVRNSLALSEVARVVCIEPISRGYLGVDKWATKFYLNDKLTIEMLLRFRHLREIDLSLATPSVTEFQQLQALPELERLILPEDLLVPQSRKQIQQWLPQCELTSLREATRFRIEDSAAWIEETESR